MDKLADRLLASPRYGERMAIQWLDFARYADSNGFQSDSSRQMWHWRDWVIDAFNRNMPFDEFTLEQLAGDMLPNATRDQIVASGFQRNGRLNGEGGRIVEEWFAETIIDRVETTGMTWMGLTLGCCRCHDHKFDPITQKEFYQFGAFFNSSDENGVLDDFGGSGGTRRGGNSRPVLALPSPEQEAQMAKMEATVKAAQQHLAEAQKQLPQLEKDWEVKFRDQLQDKTPAWQPLAAEAKSEGGATLTRLEDGTWLASGKNPPNDTYTVTAPIAPGDFSGLLIETFPDPSLPAQSLGRNGNGNYVLTSVEAEISAPSLPQQLVADFTRAEADYEQKGYEVKLIVEENKPKRGKQKDKKGWAIDGNDPAKKVPRKAMFVTSTPLTIPPDATIMIRLKHEAIANHNIGRFPRERDFAAADRGQAGRRRNAEGDPRHTGHRAGQTHRRAMQYAAEILSRQHGQSRVARRDGIGGSEEETRRFPGGPAEHHGHEGTAAAARSLRPHPRRVRQARGKGRARAARRPATAARRRPDGPARPFTMAHLSRESAHRSRVGESRVGKVLRHGHRAHHGESRFAGGVAEQSGVARFSRHGICAAEMGYEGHAKAAGHERRLPAVVAGHARIAGAATRRIGCSRVVRVSACPPNCCATRRSP
ncbi:MAG: DUF1549 domain-containing protein [Chthoniobacter sp.]